jgi:hypothetical protein
MKKNKPSIAILFRLNPKSKNKTFPSPLSDSEKKERLDFYNMLLKIEKKRPNLNAKRLMKRIYPDFFKIK